ncbi:SRPBCC domain-containing protein [Aquimarina hainanensis]|uniref:SRPBCC domain-containing protein n=1 Tax=Aquimarina hainanensis TaxID=1578017 RepID=A0ABW5NCV3_9FLAO|nr:SRPBCC domain-containing protein [Aquimarina sp. TRL1]QKX06594.1 activator of HSP90 ATPase [Aquimarina sp. TRL1]
MNNSNKTITIKRTFDAPLSLVWEAWTTAEHIAHWWGPKGMKTTIIEHHFEEGGTWKYSMIMPDGNEFLSEGTYLTIIPFKKIKTTADFKPMTEGVQIEILFEESGGKTDFTFHVMHPTEAYRIAQEKMGIYNGWGSVFDRLQAYLITL